ncbi:MAG: hypothetical protein II263_04200, partial [Lachnospiraceae bacterium]|nr:hypothetical protein [Lachnospiraceae bacterium]
DALKRGLGPNDMQESYNRAVDAAIGRAKSVLGISVERPAALKPQEKAPAVVKTVSKQVEDQLENALMDKLFGNANKSRALENQKNAFRERIRGTEGFKKLIAAGDDHVNGILGDPEKMNTAFSIITNEMRGMLGLNQPKNQNNAPQRNNEREMEPVRMSQNIIGQ